MYVKCKWEEESILYSGHRILLTLLTKGGAVPSSKRRLMMAKIESDLSE
jgi:hypothetical protein